MLTIELAQLPIPENEFRDGLEAYRKELEDHATTENVPAPLPVYEAYREIVLNHGGEFTIVKPEVPVEPVPPSKEEIAASKAKAANELVSLVLSNPEAVAALRAALK